MPAHDGEPTLASLQHEFPAWTCWQSPGGLLYARRRQASPGRPDVWGQDPPGLREAITRFLRTPQHDALTTAPAKDTL